MNYLNHPYPSSIDTLIKQAHSLAEEIKAGAKNVKHLKDLYYGVDKAGVKNAEHLNYLNSEVDKKDGIKQLIKRKVSEFPKFTLNSKISEKKDLQNNELKGIYIFIENDIPVYIGISRTIFRRLRQHGWGEKHNQCTLAYLIANSIHYKSSFSKARSEFPDHLLDEAKEKIKSFKVHLIPVDNDYDLYFLEVTLAGLLKTKWNSFRTH